MITPTAPTDSCDELRLYWLDHYESSLDPEHSLRVARHLASCDACRTAYEAEMRIARRLREEPVPAVPGIWERIEARIAAGEPRPAAAGSRTAAPEAPAIPAPGRAWRARFSPLRSRWAASAAALLLLATAGLLYRAVWEAPAGPHIAVMPEAGDSGFDAGTGKPPAKDTVSPREIRVEIAWPGPDRPAAGARIEVVREGRVTATGTILGFGRAGRLSASLRIEPDAEVRRHDEVRAAR